MGLVGLVYNGAMPFYPQSRCCAAPMCYAAHLCAAPIVPSLNGVLPPRSCAVCARSPKCTVPILHFLSTSPP